MLLVYAMHKTLWALYSDIQEQMDNFIHLSIVNFLPSFVRQTFSIY